VDLRVVEELEVTPGGMAKGLLLGGVDRLHRSAKVLTGAGTDFNEDQDIPATADQVDFAPGGAIVAGEHPVTVTAQK